MIDRRFREVDPVGDRHTSEQSAGLACERSNFDDGFPVSRDANRNGGFLDFLDDLGGVLTKLSNPEYFYC